MSECLFCRIAGGDVEADVVAEGEGWLAFRDISPQAPVHVLVIPREHVATASELDEDHDVLVGRLVRAAAGVARDEGLEDAGYRLVVNAGEGAGQSVFHLHVHLLGGRPLRWPPG